MGNCSGLSLGNLMINTLENTADFMLVGASGPIGANYQAWGGTLNLSNYSLLYPSAAGQGTPIGLHDSSAGGSQFNWSSITSSNVYQPLVAMMNVTAGLGNSSNEVFQVLSFTPSTVATGPQVSFSQAPQQLTTALAGYLQGSPGMESWPGTSTAAMGWYPFSLPGGGTATIISYPTASSLTGGYVGVLDGPAVQGELVTVDALGGMAAVYDGALIPGTTYYVNAAGTAITTVPGSVVAGEAIDADTLLVQTTLPQTYAGLNVVGNVTIAGGVSVAGNMGVTGHLIVSETIITDELTVQQDLNVGTSLSVGSTLSVGGNTTMTGTLTVYGSTQGSLNMLGATSLLAGYQVVSGNVTVGSYPSGTVFFADASTAVFNLPASASTTNGTWYAFLTTPNPNNTKGASIHPAAGDVLYFNQSTKGSVSSQDNGGGDGIILWVFDSSGWIGISGGNGWS